MTQRPLTESEKVELADLNAAVQAAIEARRAWLDAKMHECSALKVGDDIYNLHTGAKVGKVAELYRYWRDRDDGIRDTSARCDYQHETMPRRFDNTSRQAGISFGTQQEAVAILRSRADQIARGTI